MKDHGEKMNTRQQMQHAAKDLKNTSRKEQPKTLPIERKYRGRKREDFTFHKSKGY